MRTTLDIDDDVLEVARALAAAEGQSLGQAVSGLARRGLSANLRVDESGLPRFKVPVDATPITDQTVRAALDEG
ncbi:MAG: antitoxin [Acidimicrobiales bacterium]